MSHNPLIVSYLNQFKVLYEGTAWYGESFLEKFEGLESDQAFIQPASLHSIAQIVWHCIYWRIPLIKRLQGDFAYKSSVNDPKNWLPNESLKNKGWENLKGELAETQQQIINLLKSTSEAFLKAEYRPNITIQVVIEGGIHHDIYHIGQIGLIKKWIT